ncbi:uncharacterized protein [Setaria viridis]|uniref:uncharacterized protein n=1 Tax=Setaria viridis TaxID=4556 RepID=UPI0014934DA9|nr:uncharacterized protein LOC117849309 [Setaria viridis]
MEFHRRRGGRVDEERGPYMQRGSPSPDRRHGRHGAQTVVREVGPGGGWPTLTKTNYVEWAVVMRVRLQVRHMWEAVRYGDVDYDEDRRALDALIATVSPEMQFSLSQKRTAKEAWDTIAATRIGSDRARKSTLQKMVQYGDDTYGEERAVEKLLRCIPEKYKQIARSIESLLDLSRMSIEEAIGRLKVIDSDESQPPSAASATAALLHLDEPRAHAFLGDGSNNDKTEGWCLDTSATQHMIGQREFFTELDSSVRGTVKFGDASGVEIKGVGFVIFTTESGEHRLLTGVYYIPALRNSIISLG